MEELGNFITNPIVLAVLGAATLVGCVAGIGALFRSPTKSTTKVVADRGSIAAGGNQTVGAPVATNDSTIATDQSTVVTNPSGGQTIIVQPGGTANFITYVDGWHEVSNRDHFEEGLKLQEAEKHEEAIREFHAAFVNADTDSHRGVLHLLVGISQYMLSRFAQAEGSFRESLRLFQSAGDEQGEVAALGDLGNIYLHRGDLDKAEEHYQQILVIDRATGNQLGEATALGNLGIIYRRRGDLDRAKAHYQQALAIYGETDNRLGQAQSLGNLGNVYFQRDDLDKAEEHYQQALDIDRKIDNRLGEARQLGSLGNVYANRGDTGKAEAYYKQALAIDREIGNRLDEAQDLGNLGLTYGQRGELEKARASLNEAQSIFRDIGVSGAGHQNVRQALELIERLKRERQESGKGESD